MTCKSFLDLNPVERVLLIGKSVHLIQEDETVFLIVSELVDKANFEGVFEKIKFLPETVEGSA